MSSFYIYYCERSGRAMTACCVEPGEGAVPLGEVTFDEYAQRYWASSPKGEPLARFTSQREAREFLRERHLGRVRRPAHPG